MYCQLMSTLLYFAIVIFVNLEFFLDDERDLYDNVYAEANYLLPIKRESDAAYR
eukprot:gene33975-43920_t